MMCTHADSTDVQSINVVTIEPRKIIYIVCQYMPGSDANGCLVVLVGKSRNVTVNLTKENECSIQSVPLPSSLLSVFGYDIESDGSIATLPVLGRIDDTTTYYRDNKQCSIADTNSGKLHPLATTSSIYIIAIL